MIIYKTVNLINGKIYIGKDEFNNPNYLGSGMLLKRAINKYGLENFEKQIIDTASNRNELCEKEIFWIHYYKCRGYKMYNIANGGEGGDTLTNHPNYDNICKHLSEISQGENNPFFGKTHTDKTKREISLKARRRADYRKYKRYYC